MPLPPIAALAVASTLLIGRGPTAVSPELAAALRTAWDANTAAVEAEDRAAFAATLHPDAPGRTEALRLFDLVLPKVDVAVETLTFVPLAVDGDVAVVRISKATRGRSGTFVDNELEVLTVFRLRDGRPLVWSQVPLSVREAQPPR